MRILCSLMLFLLCFPLAASQNKKEIRPDNSQLLFTGRIDRSDPDRPVIFWPGTKVTLRVEGTSEVSVILDDALGINRFYLIVDNDDQKAWKFKCRKGKHEYTYPEKLGSGIHTVELFKASEYIHGSTEFIGFNLGLGSIIHPPLTNRKRILFLGDSITCGMGVFDKSGVRQLLPKYTDHYFSYAAMVTRRLGVDHVAIARNGIGFMESWYSVNMPQLFLRLRPDNPNININTAEERPDLIIVNLGQNDSMLVNRKEGFLFTYKGNKDDYIVDKYLEFMEMVIAVYPNTPIICALGSMDAVKPGSPWPGYISRSVDILRSRHPKTRIERIVFPWQNTKFHPVIDEQKRMADQLEPLIREVTGW